jgi:uncharacterized membrane protein
LLVIARTLVLDSGLNIYLAILGMGLATYATRLAGYWLLQGRAIKGRMLASLEAVPPAILTAVIAPAVFMEGNASMIAGAITLTSALLRLPLLVTISIGVCSLAVLRQII